MNTWTRRTLIGLGAVLLIGGWGITGYTSKWTSGSSKWTSGSSKWTSGSSKRTSGLTNDALYAHDRQPEEPDEQRPLQAGTQQAGTQQASTLQASTRTDLWEQRGGAEIFAAGVLSMALGAGVIGFAALRANT